jgi:hypothetical protein
MELAGKIEGVRGTSSGHGSIDQRALYDKYCLRSLSPRHSLHHTHIPICLGLDI